MERKIRGAGTDDRRPIVIKRCPECERIKWRGRWRVLTPEEEIAIFAYSDSRLLRRIFSKTGRGIEETRERCTKCAKPSLIKNDIDNGKFVRLNKDSYSRLNLGLS